MRANEPVIDDREQAELFETLRERADQYVADWDPHSSDVGHTLLRIFSSFEGDVRKRLNEVPEKQRLAFLDALDFDRRRPQAARTPLSFEVSTELDRNVPIPGGTTAIADGDDKQFELPQDGGFEATPAQLESVIGVTPTTDGIVDHSAVVDGDEIDLFGGENLQSHELYMEAESSLNLDPGSTFSCRIEATSAADTLFDETIWEYYGEDEAGEEGWHPLEVVEVGGKPDGESGVEALQTYLQETATQDRQRYEADDVAQRLFRVPGEITTHEVNGIESRWLRCSMPEAASLVQTTIRSMSLHVASTDRDEGLEPDMMLSNDIPLAPDEGEIRPFGRDPHPPVTFFLACEEALTKPGGVVELEFSPSENETAETDSDATDVEVATPDQGMGVLNGPPQISWEYWNGTGWTRLDSVTDETSGLQSAGRVQFQVPDDIGATTVSGHENVWVRARLVSGNYGRPSFEVTDEGTRGSLIEEPDAPVYEDVTVQYERGDQSFDTIFGRHNAAFSENLAGEPFSPFVELPDEEQTVYFGFDDRLENGPLSLFVPVEDSTYPPAFDPGLQWEYCTDPDRFEWKTLDTRDQTGGLTERGIVMLTLPTPTESFELFGRDRHWIRARLTEDAFDVHSSLPEDGGGEQVDATAERTTEPPTLDGVYQNTQLAYNKITIEDEILGSSDGSHEQSFTCAHAPVIDIELWVDELSTLSAGECRRLAEEHPERTRPEYDSREELTAFWVRWEPVDDFLDSAPQDRAYVISRTLGTVRFGDGNAGRIPPSGQDNVQATYTTGGGSDGNVDAGTVTDLKSSIALVDTVTNPIPADGGADIESTETLVRRSTNRLKHRNRAVTARDYEQLAKAEYPELARVSCEPEHGTDQSRVTVLIIPQTDREKPVPSIELKHGVRETLAAHAPASLVEDDSAEIVVRGPGYSELSVEATVHATNVKSVSLLKSTIRERLDEYLHPLTGNEGIGWPFGELPTSEALEDVIAGVESVSAVDSFELNFDAGGEHRSFGDYDSYPDLPEDTLVCSGDHQITVTMEGYDGD
jgi:uncharacterized phage protein gp47/JayE